jgi:hypothetical protein
MRVPKQEIIRTKGTKKKKNYTQVKGFVLISGIGLVLAYRFDSKSYYGFGL